MQIEPSYSLTYIPEGDAGSLATVEKIRQAILFPSYQVREQTEKIISRLPSLSLYSQAEAIFDWVQKNTRYIHDKPEVEEVRFPDYMLRRMDELGIAYGDCDDLVSLYGALLHSVGIPVKLVIISLAHDENYTFSHIFIRVLTEYGWVSADPSNTKESFGWQPENIVREMEVSI